MVIFPIAISGAGKTTYGNKLKEKIPNLEIVCPDDIRAEFGDISDQSHNNEVFKITSQRIEQAMLANKTIYYSATNLTKKSRANLMSLCKKYNQEVICVIFYTSYRPDICEARVRRDLDNGVNRSNTLIKNEKGDTVVRFQFQKFKMQMLNYKLLEEELKENSKQYRIKGLECEPE